MNMEKTNNEFKKWGKDEPNFMKRDIQMVQKYMRKCSSYQGSES